MINGLGDKRLGLIEASRVGLERAAPVSAVGDSGEARILAPVSTAAELAAKGAPVDSEKVAAIKAAIAEGRYPIDPSRIAEAMIAFESGSVA